MCENESYIDGTGAVVWEIDTAIVDPILKVDGNYILIAEKGRNKICLYIDNKLQYDVDDPDTVMSVRYNYYTTLKGVMEKEDSSNPEFVVPAKLKELYEAKDFGPYANCKGELPVAFLANCDITGGNSGSPMMNSRGELIGLAFDGNWDALSSDITFTQDLTRCIGVDIRYVLYIIDRWGKAERLIQEIGAR